MSQALSPVTFHGDTIFCVTIENQPYTPAKPIVENLGLAWQAQAAKLSANKERWGITIIVIPSPSGDQQTLCIPVRKLPAFLASINPNKVHAELRPKIALYQAECDDALWHYWVQGRDERPMLTDSLPPASITLTPSTPADRAPLRSIINAWARISGQPHDALWPQVRSAFNLSRIDQLPAEWVPDAIAWVQDKIDGAQRAIPAAPAMLLRHAPATNMPTEGEILQLINDIQVAHTQVEAILEPLTSRAMDIADNMADEIRRRGHISPTSHGTSQDCLNGLFGHCTFMALRRAMIAPSRVLDEYSNPGYKILGIARQLSRG